IGERQLQLRSACFFGRMVLVMTGRPPAVVASPDPSENPPGGSGRLIGALARASVRLPTAPNLGAGLLSYGLPYFFPGRLAGKHRRRKSPYCLAFLNGAA